MKNINLIMIFVGIVIYLMSCSNSEDSPEIALKNKTDCAVKTECESVSELSAGCDGCPSGKGSQDKSLVFNHKKVNPDKVQLTLLGIGEAGCPKSPKMQPVLQAIQEKYADKIQVLFYDLRNQDQLLITKKYSIRQIPTQVILNKDGKEIYRHEGFLTITEIEQFLEEHGIEPDIKS